MYISVKEKEYLIRELEMELRAKKDGGNKNLIVPECPYCGKTGGKFGIYIGKETSHKKPFMAYCFSCRKSVRDVNQLLSDIGRSDLILEDTTSFEKLDIPAFYSIEENELDDSLEPIEMPMGWRRSFRNVYLTSRGFTMEDYDYFIVGTTCGRNWMYNDYVVFPILDNGDVVGYVARHTWSKKDIDEYNAHASASGQYKIRRYNNSTDNEFSKLLYNYDSVVDGETETVVLVEGVFDAIALTRKLDLYDNHRIVPVATFGKKISDVQIYKLLSKGVANIIVAYDSDAKDATVDVATMLEEYFDVLVAYSSSEGKDFDEMDFWDIYDVFSVGLMTPTEFKMSVI